MTKQNRYTVVIYIENVSIPVRAESEEQAKTIALNELGRIPRELKFAMVRIDSPDNVRVYEIHTPSDDSLRCKCQLLKE